MKPTSWTPPIQTETAEITASRLMLHAAQVVHADTQRLGAVAPCVRVCALKALQTEAHSLRMQPDDMPANRIDLVRYRKKEIE